MKKEFRVKRNEDFSKIIARKKSFANSCFIIYKDENQIGHGRVGISVSKKLGNAVTRNKKTVTYDDSRMFSFWWRSWLYCNCKKKFLKSYIYRK